MDGDPQLEAINCATLIPLVRQALQHEAAEVLTWQWAPIAYNRYLLGRTLARYSGAALLEGAEVPWSIVLKRSRPPEEPGRVYDEERREILAYRSGLLTDIPGSLAAVRALAIHEDDAGANWLWLEDVVDMFGHQWPLEQYGRAARHLGQFNGAYLVDRVIPSFPWLMPSWIEHQSEPTRISEVLPRMAALASDARLRQAFSVPIADLAPQLVRDQPVFVGILARLPPVLCHHDAAHANLFARRASDGTIETVAVDWESIGPGTVGADIATLVFGTVRRGDFPAELVTDLDHEVFAGYIVGLEDAGWRGDPQVARLGYTASVALRWSQMLGAFRALIDDQPPAIRGHTAAISHRSATRQSVLLTQFLLQCAAEARQLARVLALIL
jgi:Ser/Thr protein kinase RdoA (MazF antagonist)